MMEIFHLRFEVVDAVFIEFLARQPSVHKTEFVNNPRLSSLRLRSRICKFPIGFSILNSFISFVLSIEDNQDSFG